jgi:putative endonuclease
MFTFYILYSQSRNRYYIGHTGDSTEERIRKHNSNHRGFTGHSGDWQLVYKESFPTKEAAYARERKVKRWKSRAMIEILIG